MARNMEGKDAAETHQQTVKSTAAKTFHPWPDPDSFKHDRRSNSKCRPDELSRFVQLQNQRTIFSAEFLSRCAQNHEQSHNRQHEPPATQMIRQADSSSADRESSAPAAHASHASQSSNRPVVPIVSQPISKPIELPPQYRPRKPRKQVNVACQPCRKRRSKVIPSISFASA